MAPLTEAALEARIESTRLRSEAHVLKQAVRGSLACSRERRDRAQVQADRARARRVVPFASPWSGLSWCREDEQLGRVLVPLD